MQDRGLKAAAWYFLDFFTCNTNKHKVFQELLACKEHYYHENLLGKSHDPTLF